MTLQEDVRRTIGRGLPWHSVELILSYAKHVYSFGRAHMASPLPSLPLDENRELGVAIESILTAALPLVAKLTKPALLLPGKLQAVIKAQRICLNSGEEYTGVWHYEGLNEHIVAVVLYFYRCSPNLEGGDMEFISRESIEIHKRFTIFDRDEATSLLEELPRCRVPVKQGTLVVFLNYQMVHRVLRRINQSSTTASRDFLGLFLVDQLFPLFSTLSLPQQTGKQASKSLRKSLFFDQLKPPGKFGISSVLIDSYGWALMGWLENQDAEIWNEDKLSQHALECFEKMSRSPPLTEGFHGYLMRRVGNRKFQ